MGWFDDEDSEDDADCAPKCEQGQPNEEDDPLDAYMKSLGNGDNGPSRPRAQRLDVENADELDPVHLRVLLRVVAAEDARSDDAGLENLFHGSASSEICRVARRLPQGRERV